jgi:hypothetical protein
VDFNIRVVDHCKAHMRYAGAYKIQYADMYSNFFIIFELIIYF